MIRTIGSIRFISLLLVQSCVILYDKMSGQGKNEHRFIPTHFCLICVPLSTPISWHKHAGYRSAFTLRFLGLLSVLMERMCAI
jgi:hypothetical protein